MPLYNIEWIWVPWIEFALLMVLVLTNIVQPHALLLGVQTLASPIQRRYADADNRLVYALQALFQTGVLAMVALIATAAQMPSHPTINIGKYLCMIAVILLITLLKSGLDRYLVATFRYGVHAPTYYNHRNTLWQLTCIVLFMYLLLAPKLGHTTLWVVPCVVAAVYLLITEIKLINLFGLSLTHLFYITLYIIHVEIVSMLAMVLGASKLLMTTI